MMAIDDINNKTDGIHDDLLPQTEIRSVLRSPRQKFYLGVEDAMSMLQADKDHGIMACIGPYSAQSVYGED